MQFANPILLSSSLQTQQKGLESPAGMPSLAGDLRRQRPYRKYLHHAKRSSILPAAGGYRPPEASVANTGNSVKPWRRVPWRAPVISRRQVQLKDNVFVRSRRGTALMRKGLRRDSKDNLARGGELANEMERWSPDVRQIGLMEYVRARTFQRGGRR